MKSRRGFAIQRLMNAMRQAHADGWFIVFDTLTLADDRLFFFQAEDGIRDVAVTGVQTCALPIYDLFTRMRDLFGGRSVLLISHRFSSVRSADRIYVLHEGRVVEHGSHDELMELGGLYAELFGLQASAYLPGPRAKTA